MKKLLFSAALLTAMVGCQTSEGLEGDLSSSSEFEVLSFNPEGNKMTRAAVDKDATTFDEYATNKIEDDFGVIIYTTKDTFANVVDNYTISTAYGHSDSEMTAMDNLYSLISNTNGKVTYAKATADYAGYAWRTDGDVALWPVDKNYKLNVYAYTPYSTTANEYPTEFTENSMAIKSYDNTAGKVNLMTAMAFDKARTVTGGYVTGGNCIDLKFYRALSQLRFNIALRDKDTDQTIPTNGDGAVADMVKIDDIQNTTKKASYTDTNLFPVAAADLTDDSKAAKVYSGADVYLQQIKVCNIPTKGDCTASNASGYTTKWYIKGADKTGTATYGQYVIWKNDSIFDTATTNGDDSNLNSTFSTYANDFANGTFNEYNSTDDSGLLIALKSGKLLTTLVEGNQAIDDLGKTDADYGYLNNDTTTEMNPFFRPLVISPFSSTTDGGVSYGVSDAIDTTTNADQPYIEFTLFVDCNGGTDTVAGETKNELVVLREPLKNALAANSRITYNVVVELAELTFDPTIEAVADVESAVDETEGDTNL